MPVDDDTDLEIVYVKWLDHWGLCGKTWYDEDDLLKGPLVIEEVGYLWEEDEQSLLIVPSIGHGGFGGATYILKATIQERRTLK